MANKILTLVDPLEKHKRACLLEKFLNSVFDQGGLPYFISNKISLFSYRRKLVSQARWEAMSQ